MRRGETVEQAVLRCLLDPRFAMWSMSQLVLRSGKDGDATKAAVAKLKRAGMARENGFGLFFATDAARRPPREDGAETQWA